MFENYLTRNLKEGEEVVAIVRPYWITMGWRLFLAGLIVVFDVFFFAWWLQFGAWGLAGFAAAFAAGMLWAARAWIVWSLNAFVLTNRRIIDVDQRGFFHRTVSEAQLGKIQDVSFRVSGLAQTMLQYGKVVVQTAGARENLELEGAHRPERLQELITKLQATVEQEQARGDTLTAAELLSLVRRIREGVAPEKLKDIIAEERADPAETAEAAERFFSGSEDKGDPPDLRRRRKGD